MKDVRVEFAIHYSYRRYLTSEKGMKHESSLSVSLSLLYHLGANHPSPSLLHKPSTSYNAAHKNTIPGLLAIRDGKKHYCIELAQFYFIYKNFSKIYISNLNSLIAFIVSTIVNSVSHERLKLSFVNLSAYFNT